MTETTPAAPTTITVECETCGARHTAEYSHQSQYGGHAVYEAICTADDLTDWYTLDADVTPEK